MKYLASILLIISFIGIATFGPALSEMGMNHRSGCIAASADGTTCPTSIVGYSLHHLSALQALTRAVVSPTSVQFLLLASILLTFLSVFLLQKPSPQRTGQFLPIFWRRLAILSSYSKSIIASWLSLFEHSPSV